LIFNLLVENALFYKIVCYSKASLIMYKIEGAPKWTFARGPKQQNSDPLSISKIVMFFFHALVKASTS